MGGRDSSLKSLSDRAKSWSPVNWPKSSGSALKSLVSRCTARSPDRWPKESGREESLLLSRTNVWSPTNWPKESGPHLVQSKHASRFALMQVGIGLSSNPPPVRLLLSIHNVWSPVNWTKDFHSWSSWLESRANYWSPVNWTKESGPHRVQSKHASRFALMQVGIGLSSNPTPVSWFWFRLNFLSPGGYKLMCQLFDWIQIKCYSSHCQKSLRSKENVCSTLCTYNATTRIL